MDEAELAEVLGASADRVEPRCAHFGICGGCSLQHLVAAAQLAAKQAQLLDNLERIGRVTPAARPRAAGAVRQWALPAARPAGGQVRAQEGPRAGGLSRAGQAVHRRHSPL